MNRTASHLLLCVLAIGCATRPTLAQGAEPSPIARLVAFRFGPDRSLLDAVAQWVADARRDPVRRRQAAAELAGVLASNAAFDAKQFACRQLIRVAGPEQTPALLAALDDPQLTHYALMALARIPGGEVSRALRAELRRRSGATLAEIADVLGERRDPLATKPLTGLLGSPDAAAADSAAGALARIGGPDALAALRRAYERAPASRKPALGDALIRCARGSARAQDAMPIYRLLSAPAAPPQLRAAALRGIAEIQGGACVPLLLAALQESGSPRQKMAAKLLREVRGPQVTARLCAALSSLSGRPRALLIEALAERGDREAAPAIVAIARGRDEEARTIALRALGSLGHPIAVPVLLDAVANGMPDDREAASDSLRRMSGNGVDEAILAVADKGARSLRVAAIETLGKRRVAGQEARLVHAACGADPEVSAAALRVLRTMGTAASLGTLVDGMLKMPAGKRDEAIAAISAIARRGATEEERTGVLVRRMAGATRAEDRSDLVALLGEVGGPRALEAIRRALSDPAEAVRMSALQTLAEWPTDEPLPDLLRVAREAPDATRRSIALRGYTRMIGANELRPADQTLALYREASALARTPAERKLVVAGLAGVKGLGALQVAAELRKDPEVAAEAELAIVEIAKSTLGAYREETKAIVEPLAAGAGDPEVRKRAAAILAVIPKLADFVTAWEVSPPYQKEGANYAALFDIPFPPEQPDRAAQTPWRLMPAGTNPDQPWLLDLLALYGGEQKVAYLRTAVWSDAERDLVLESGSDDGTKAWWNGQIVLAVNVQRAVAPAQEKTRLHAKAGWNWLMLKIPQNVMGWGAVARFTNVDGSPATGLRYAVPSAVK